MIVQEKCTVWRSKLFQSDLLCERVDKIYSAHIHHAHTECIRNPTETDTDTDTDTGIEIDKDTDTDTETNTDTYTDTGADTHDEIT